MRADRLITLLMLLQTNGRMTAQELADRLEVSPRTIYRDLDALSASGVPVYAERGPQGGCMLMEQYRTNLTGLKESEVRALFMFTVPGLLAELGADKDSESALLKLQAALPAPFQKDAAQVRQRLHLDPAPWFHPPEPAPYLALVQDAIWAERRLRMRYRRGDGQWVKRLLDPYGLVAKASVWYVVGSINRGQIVVYRVSRIQEAEMTDGRFQRPDDFNLAEFWETWRSRFEARQQAVTVILHVPPAGVPALVQQFGEGAVPLITAAEPVAEDGTVRLSWSFASEDDACRALMGMGTAVSVVSPPSLREKIAAQARKLLLLYAAG